MRSLALDVSGRYRYPTPNHEWLSRDREAVIEPDLPTVDAHHRLWEQHEQPYLLEALQEDGVAQLISLADVLRVGHSLGGALGLRLTAAFPNPTAAPAESECVILPIQHDETAAHKPHSRRLVSARSKTGTRMNCTVCFEAPPALPSLSTARAKSALHPCQFA